MPTNAVALTKLILLIDGENLDSKYAGAIRAKVAELGTMIDGRVYGKADNGRMMGWRKNPDAVGLKMIDVKVTSKQKNAADFRLVIEAMDLLYTRHVDVLCIGSSDGDFSALATRVKAQALGLYGFGEKKAPAVYRAICDDFFDCALLIAGSKTAPRTRTAPPKAAPARQSAPPPIKVAPAAASPRPARQPATPPAAQPAERARRGQQPATPKLPVPSAEILAAIERVRDTDSWSHLGSVSNQVRRALKDFSPQNHGHGTLKKLIAAMPEVESHTTPSGATFVRRRGNPGAPS